MEILRIENFSYEPFQKAFKAYFNEFDEEVDDWEDLFEMMNEQGGNYAYLLMENDECIGFIEARNEEMTHWFLNQKFGFIREFWIKPSHRKQKLGHLLISTLEDSFKKDGLKKVYLTAAESLEFYLDRGYQIESSITAKNDNEVLSKTL